MKRKLFLSLAVFIILVFNAQAQSIALAEWKFIRGDKPEYISWGKKNTIAVMGHGNSTDDVSPGFPGYILTGLEDKDNYIYRGTDR